MTDLLLTTSPDAAQRLSLNARSIICGWLVATGFAWLFYLLGLAVGFSALDAADTAAVAKGLGIGTAIWVVLTWVVSLFLGGMFASWTDARPSQTVGVLHGVAVWGLAMTVTVILGAVGFTHLLQGGASLLQGAAAAGASASSSAAEGLRNPPLDRAAGALAAEIERAVVQAEGRSGPPSASPSATPASSSGTGNTSASATAANQGGSQQAISSAGLSAIALDLLNQKTDDAKTRLIAETGMSSEAADNVIHSLSSRVDKYRANLQAAADKAQHYISAGLWALFLGSILALVAAAFGGWIGAGHIDRVHD